MKHVPKKEPYLRNKMDRKYCRNGHANQPADAHLLIQKEKQDASIWRDSVGTFTWSLIFQLINKFRSPNRIKIKKQKRGGDVRVNSVEDSCWHVKKKLDSYCDVCGDISCAKVMVEKLVNF